MSWFRSALSICIPEPGSYYSAIDPVSFYEWRYTGSVPKGTAFTKQLPPSDIFTKGQVVVSAFIPDDSFKTIDGQPRLAHDVQTDVILKVGYMPSSLELIDKYKEISSSMDRGLSGFQEDISVRKFIYSDVMEPNLFGVSKISEDEVTFNDYGPLDEVIDKFAEVREAIMLASEKKTGRAYEMEDFRNYEQVMTFVNNSHVHVDELKMNHLISKSGLQARATKTVPWKDFYLKSSQGARDKYKLMNRFENTKWFQAAWPVVTGVK